ncbi:MAG: hypothetical protein HND58_08430 [Planctomycetota bacterium]|nr:MAG: hypothetical protein HND58_08430 [Planctomycetota bacterium]
MDALLNLLTTLYNLLLVVIGFGLVVFIHEMGHFLTARWAKIRVFAFALGFGPAVVSYRRGIGWRRGSSEGEYLDLIKEAEGFRGEARENARAQLSGRVSPTEYRLNALPFGGYVKMLGQHDLHPESAGAGTPPDSYLAKPIWKRMIVISGGVVMNIILALAIFMFVFFVGLETEPAKIGLARADTPAARAIATNAETLGVTQTGLQPGDVVLKVNDREPDDFNDIIMAAAMSGPGESLNLLVQRPGVNEPLRFSILPERDTFTNLLDIGVTPVMTLTIPEQYGARPDDWRAAAATLGLTGVEPGMRVVSINGETDLSSFADLRLAAERSGGAPVEVTFADDDGTTQAVSLTPTPRLMRDDADPAPDLVRPVDHLLGLVPVMTVAGFDNARRGYEQGLREGDIFARLGEVEFPSLDAGIREVQKHSGRSIEVVVLRAGESGRAEEVAFAAAVTPAGLIGFTPGTTADTSGLVTLAPRSLHPIKPDASPYTPAALEAITRPGSRILSVGGTPVSDLADIRAALTAATAEADANGADSASVTVEFEPPLPTQPDGSRLVETATMTIDAGQLERLHALGWDLPIGSWLFAPESFTLRATGPIDAIRMGINRTERMMAMTYLTIARLVQGTVKVDNLKGPVGIAHLGTQVASRGYIWLIFFMGLISVNLAVINFLPLPIADGGQFLMLLYEGLRGRPLPIPVQNAITAAGLLLLVSVFLLVTYNDVSRLFGG